MSTSKKEVLMNLRTPLSTLAAAASMALAMPVLAASTQYSFSGLYNAAGGSQLYTGVFSITDPVQTSVRPGYAADVTQPNIAAVWSGTSDFYTGGTDLQITFASGAVITSASFDIVVDNTRFAGTGSPYSPGLSVQMYAPHLSIAAPTHSVCATPTGVCGPDDDPLYQDATQAAVMATTGLYFAFYDAPLSTSPGVPVLDQAFPLGHGGLGVFSVVNGMNVSTLTSFNSFTSTTSAVPEPGTACLLLPGLLGIVWVRRSSPQAAGQA
jgi:hypothetical protein